jgi:formylglycine-generating enzyme required for sulfatase activity
VAGVSFDMVRVPPGRFIDGEGVTRRELLVSRPFELGVTLVTQALWRAVMGSEPSKFLGEDRPVEQVSWDDFQVFLARLSGLGFPGFRLPTEAEWVWAARCGVSTRWAGADRAQSVSVVGSRRTLPVAGSTSSASGAFDLSGNVQEWQKFGWAALSPGVDLEGPVSGSSRVFRGGGWGIDPRGARVTYRLSGPPDFRGSSFGFRLFRTAL